MKDYYQDEYDSSDKPTKADRDEAINDCIQEFEDEQLKYKNYWSN